MPAEQTFRMMSVQSPVIPLVGDLVRQTPGCISLGQGVVNYPPPPAAAGQIQAFLDNPGNHKYQMVQGIPLLLEALSSKLAAENGISMAAGNDLVVTAGGNMAFMNAVLAIGDAGDEFILPAPYYFNHDMAIALAGCRAVPVPTDSHYQLSVDVIAAALTPRTRAVVTVSPNNPSGAVYSRESLQAVNELCHRHGLYHINDEAYEYFTYDDARHFSPASLPGSDAHTISLFSFSKSYGFASWRIGWMVIPRRLFESVRKIQDTILICPPVISQFGALGCLEAGSGYCRDRLPGIASVRQRLLADLSAITELCEVPAAQGAFYVLLKVHTRMGAMELVTRLVREHGVAVIPGSAFGVQDRCLLRVAYASLDETTAAEGIGRLVSGLRAIVREKRA